MEGEKAASRVVMVTGPNMGGKSTLMRQTGLIVILSQLVSCGKYRFTCSHANARTPAHFHMVQ